jgi:hypothetical protein
MKKFSSVQLVSLFLLATLSVVAQSCGPYEYGKIDHEYEVRTWGGWQLISMSAPSPTTPLEEDQYLERNYKGFQIKNHRETIEIDSVLLFRKRQLIFEDRVAEELSKDAVNQKIVYRLTSGKYYWIKLLPVDGPEDGTGNDQLLVSDFVDNYQDLDKAVVYTYVRTNYGKRPW